MAIIEFQISTTMINWIATHNGTTVTALADRLAPKKQEKFLKGIINKTIAEKLTKLGGIPFGYLFLATPPKISKSKIPDLRQTVNATELSANFYETLEDVKNKVNWYKDYLENIGSVVELSFIGKFELSKNLSPTAVACDIIKIINFDLHKELPSLTHDSYFKKIASLLENIGILVFKNGVVKNNNAKTLDVNEFRGFSLIDKVAPAVFVNSKDSFSAQTFTLLHEVAHLWIGKEGVSNWTNENKIEAFCNQVAAEILMPTEILLRQWNRCENVTIQNKVFSISQYFKVSPYAAAIKLYQLGLVQFNVVDDIKNRLINLNSKKNGGGNFYYTVPYRNSQKLTTIIVNSAMSQNILLRDAAKLLNVKPDSVVSLYYKILSKEVV